MGLIEKALKTRNSVHISPIFGSPILDNAIQVDSTKLAFASGKVAVSRGVSNPSLSRVE